MRGGRSSSLRSGLLGKVIPLPAKASLRGRKVLRHKVDLRVRVTPDGQATIHCRSNDLNKIGMGVLLPGELPIGTRATLEFSLPDNPVPLKLRSILRHREGFRSGFEFVHLTSAENQAIREFCDEMPLE
jgi:hypothetical protein